MTTLTDKKVIELRERILEDERPGSGDVSHLERLNYRLSDAIREGASVSQQAVGWGNGDTMCALHAGLVAAKARGYIS